ncbi:MAG: protein-export chaperone SecB [Rickettsiales bacterium]|jgi:preprotein translocase subunit SecB|nr:protein-export chaperone SecB [Rickettsiales bacterium]
MQQFKMISEFLKKFSFVSPNTPDLFFSQKDGAAAKMDINVDINIKSSETQMFMVDLIVNIDSKLDGGKVVFQIGVEYSALIQIDGDPKGEGVKHALLVDVPRLLFPAVRGLVMQATGESGFPPLHMQSIDFEEMYANRK